MSKKTTPYYDRDPQPDADRPLREARTIDPRGATTETQEQREAREAYQRTYPKVPANVPAPAVVDPYHPDTVAAREAFDKRAEDAVAKHQAAADDKRSAAVRATDQALKQTPNT